jgi:photosystem II stability/assembly factor-like uncharacterized protein
VLCAVVCVGPARALGASPLGWSAPVIAEASGSPKAISCPSRSLCVAVDDAGRVLTSNQPTAPAPAWAGAAEAIDSLSLTGVSCPSAALCVAVDAGGRALFSTNPSAGAPSWSSPAAIDPGNALTGVSCPSASLCVAVDAAGNVLASTSPGSSGGGWTTRSIDPEREHIPRHLRAVSCASASLCVAVDDVGNAFASAGPGSGGTWSERAIDPALRLVAVSCQPAGQCLAVDESGNGLASADPVAATPTWTSTPIEPGGRLAAVSCAPETGLCVALDTQGGALASDNAASAVPSWSASSADPGGAPTGLACVAAGFCFGIDGAGRSFTGRVRPPLATTTVPAEVTATTATLSGALNPEDAQLESCRFEYGADAFYGHSVPCTSVPSPVGATQPVSARIEGLIPNATYHFRLVAVSALGTGYGADEVFTTAVSAQIALVYPHPSISGSPASGQRLSCHPGTPAGALVQLTYAWLRDLIPIAGATGSSYGVRDTDTGHHLQCQVTATDGGGSATARSAFVTVPVGGIVASVGETTVGAVRFARGRLTVPISCSPLAPQGCRITIRATVLQASRRGHRAALTIAFLRSSLSAGQRRTLVVALSRAARRLLAARRTLPAEVTVSGTVIGVIEASLVRERLLLGRTAGRRSAHGHARSR